MEFLEPKNYNKIQRIIFLSILTLMMLLLFFHFPFKGYYYQETTDDCLNFGEIGDMYYPCQEFKRVIMPFYDWESKGAIIGWLGNLSNFLITMIFLSGIGVLWLYIFKNKKDE